MEKMMRRHWWKVLGVLLVLYGIVAGMLVPLKSNVIDVSVGSAQLGETISMDITGYNTSFLGADAGAVKGWLRARWVDSPDQEFSVAASQVVVHDDRRATLTFTIPDYLPDTEAEKTDLSLIVQNPADGYFVDPGTVTVRQTDPAPDAATARAGWTITSIKSGDVTATPYTTFPFRGHLAETIRNTYFHVSLWFAMMFIFVAACVYAVKYLIRSGKASLEATDQVSLRDKADYWTSAFTAVGLLFGVLGLLTGAVWAKHTWLSYWTWDPKQVTTLIALLIYAGYFILRAAIPDQERRARVSASYNIFAFACLIPLIYILPRMVGNSLHPGAAGNPAFGGEDLDNTMRMVFYPIIIGWTLFGFWMAGVSYRVKVLGERLEQRLYSAGDPS